jgi:hypothetical protein
MSIADLGRTIIKNNSGLLLKKPFLRKFKNLPNQKTNSLSKKKPFHKKAKSEEIQKQKYLNKEESRLLSLKRVSAIIISVIIITVVYSLLMYFFDFK